MLLGLLLLSIFADFGQVISISHFSDFEQVISKISHFADLEQVKKTKSKTPVEETGCLCIFFFYASCHQHSILASQTYEGLHQL